MEKIRAVAATMKGHSIFVGIEVDILADGEFVLSDSMLEQMDVVIASVHSHFNQDRDTMTRRLLKTVAILRSSTRPSICAKGHRRMAKQRGVKVVISTDSHHTSHLEKLRYGVIQARRACLPKEDVLNTLPPQKFANAMKHGWWLGKKGKQITHTYAEGCQPSCSQFTQLPNAVWIQWVIMASQACVEVGLPS